ncbi:MAG: hypothetical protein Q8Q80_04420 [Methyloversatilis sp.]|nr:hypothetical protein [Methyloversatilis sp.]MDP3871887.1 hypothetical protein [Methyloversatilis sp.]
MQRLKSMVPAHIWKLVAPYALTPLPTELPTRLPNEQDTHARREDDAG